MFPIFLASREAKKERKEGRKKKEPKPDDTRADVDRVTLDSCFMVRRFVR